MITNEETNLKAFENALEKHRKGFMALGALSLVLGIVGLLMSVTVTLATTVVFGVFTVVAGILFFIEAFSQEDFASKLFMSLVGVMYIVGGTSMTIHPTASAMWITLVMAFFFILIGIIKIVSGFMMRKESSSWSMIVFNGVVGLIMGILIYNDWPESGLWVIGMFISIELIMQGISIIAISRAAKKLEKRIEV